LLSIRALQFAGCSHGAFYLTAATGQEVTDGILDVNLNLNVTGRGADSIVDAAQLYAEGALGSSIEAFDHGKFGRFVSSLC